MIKPDILNFHAQNAEILLMLQEKPGGCAELSFPSDIY